MSGIKHMVTLQQVMCLYQELVPAMLSDSPTHVSSLLEGVRGVGEGVGGAGERGQDEEDRMLPQLYLLKLLAGTDARQLPWAKEVSDCVDGLHLVTCTRHLKYFQSLKLVS